LSFRLSAFVALLAACSVIEDPLTGAKITVDPMINPRLTPEAAGTVAVEQLRANEAQLGRAVAEIRILSIAAIRASDVGQAEPSANLPPGDGIVWVIRARGTFVAQRGPRFEPESADSGYFVISDVSGALLATGFP
jgi:hypothetical protein